MIAIEEFKNKITKKSRLIGLDLGSKRIGIAICDEYQSIATPFKTIQKDNFNKFLDELKLIINEKNLGAGESRNNAIKIANGEYIAFCDDDDIWHRTKLEKTINIFHSKTRVDIV